jgi:hypothetical protein
MSSWSCCAIFGVIVKLSRFCHSFNIYVIHLYCSWTMLLNVSNLFVITNCKQFQVILNLNLHNQICKTIMNIIQTCTRLSCCWVSRSFLLHANLQVSMKKERVSMASP